MRRLSLLVLSFPLILAACSQTPADTTASGSESVNPEATSQAVAVPLTFTAMGDLPYFGNINSPTGTLDTRFKTLLQKVDAIPDNDFTVHVGDFMRGSTADCDPSTAVRLCNVDERKNYYWNYLYPAFNGLKRPFNLTLGDNDWSDYNDQAPGEGIRTLQEVLRPKFFPQTSTLGQTRFYVNRLSLSSTDPNVQPYIEDSYWQRGDIAFAAIHVPNGNYYKNNSAEYQARYQANYRSLSSAFYDAKIKNLRAVVIFSQAWPDLNHDYTTSGRVNGYRDLALYLQRKIREFGKPVLFIHGDLHSYTFQQPSVPEGTPSLSFPNLLRLEVPGDPVVGAVVVKIDPNKTGIDMFSATCKTAPGSSTQAGCTSW